MQHVASDLVDETLDSGLCSLCFHLSPREDLPERALSTKIGSGNPRREASSPDNYSLSERGLTV
jgi:hypothetical protein